MKIFSKNMLEGRSFECDSDQTTCRRGVYLSEHAQKCVGGAY